ncbi:MAG: CPBP family intramembrane metalloprotease [Aphanothece sp. CMT-3BRIN-NPC111]|jgi:hypothetical protein|nr:CPBP family intramembrane metalloprotease [Aphanothece sp. CMT-3BRIN-NPC111]
MALLDQATDQWLALLRTSPAFLKAIAFFVVWMAVWLPVVIPLATLLHWRPPKPLTTEQKLPILASLYLIAPLIVWGASWVEGLSFLDYGVRTLNLAALMSLGLGLVLGVLGLAVIFAVQRALGWVDWHWENRERLSPILLPVLLLGLWISGTEELVFRGFLFNELQQDYSIWVAAAIASLIFALLHLVWERQETVPQLPGLWLMGMVLTLAVWVDGGSLALACGLHAGWIWGLSCLDTAQLITYTGIGSKWMTGIAQKPLAGVAGIVCLLVTGVVLELLYIGLPKF